MKSLTLFIVVTCCPLDVTTAGDPPSVYVRVSWSMAWRRFCHYVPFFAEKISEELYETKVLVPYLVKASRIRFMNAMEQCKGKGNEKDAILDFFVSKSEHDLGTRDVDRNITISAYLKLRDYWRNKKMALLDPVFTGKVKNVEILGKDKPDISEDMTESTRVGIGITIALIVVFFIAGIALCLKLKRSHKKRPLGVSSTSIPLRVIHSGSSRPTKQTEAPPAYDLTEREDRDGRSSYNGYSVSTLHGSTAFDDEHERRKERNSGYAFRNHGSVSFDEEYEGKQDSHNLAYDYEHFGSPML